MNARAYLRLVPNAHGASDAELIACISRHDRAALGTLYDRYARSLYLFARRLVPDDGADDVVQLVFLRVSAIADSFDPDASSARPWLFGVAVRVAQEHRRAAHRFTDLLAKLVRAPAHVQHESSDRRRDLELALATLSDAKRAVFLLAEVEEFSCDEIAAMLSIPVGTVYTRLFHARKELRKHLETTP